MSRLGDRLKKLEEAEPERCGNCRDWPEPFIVYAESGKDPLEDVPDHCPKCRNAPFIVVVHFTEEAGRL